MAILEKLIAAAEQEGKPEHAHLAERLMMPARTQYGDNEPLRTPGIRI